MAEARGILIGWPDNCTCTLLREGVSRFCDWVHTINEESADNYEWVNFVSLRISSSEQPPLLPLTEVEMDAIVTAVHSNTHVDTLRFYLSSVDVAGLTRSFIGGIFSSHPSLKEIEFVGSYATGVWISEALKKNTSLKQLEVVHNHLGDKGARALTDMIKINTSLESLDISGNSIGFEGGEAIALALNQNKKSSLKCLNLAFNHLGDRGCKAIASAIDEKSTLTTLTLEGNGIGDALAIALCRNKSLENLGLLENFITDTGCQYIATALRGKSSLCTLDIGVLITDDGAKELAEALETNYTLERLRIWLSEVSDEQSNHILSLCNNNQRLKRIFAQMKQEICSISLALFSKALELVGEKPGLVFELLKARPDVFRERRNQRRRMRPEWFRY